MARKAVIDAVAARLAEVWSRCPVRGLNGRDGETAKDASAFLVVQYPVANARQISFGSPGSNVFREVGTIRFVLTAKRSAGLDEAVGWTDELATLFQAKRFGGVRTFAPSSPAIDDRNEEGTQFLLSISVPYEHDALG